MNLTSLQHLVRSVRTLAEDREVIVLGRLFDRIRGLLGDVRGGLPRLVEARPVRGLVGCVEGVAGKFVSVHAPQSMDDGT